MNFDTFFNTLAKARQPSEGASAPAATTTPSSISTRTTATTTTTTAPPTSAVSRSDALSPSSSSVSASGTRATIASSSSSSRAEEEESSGKIVGLEVNKPAFSFSTSSCGSLEDLPHPQCTPIAFYNSDAPYGSGRLVAVSDQYICYAIKDGHIRGINRLSVMRTLLKGHKKPVIDMAFASRTTCVLASLGGDGSFYLWTIVEAPTRDPSKGKTHDLTPVPLLAVTNIHLQRVVWHPKKANTVAVVGPNGEVALVNTNALIEKLTGGSKPGSGPAPLLDASSLADLHPEWKFNAHSSRVLDLSFSPDGRYLVTAGADGWARVWDVDARNAVARWQPYSGEAVTRALFLHRSKGASSGEKLFVVTGGKQDSEVKLWRAWTALTPINTQTLTFQDDDNKGRAFHLEVRKEIYFMSNGMTWV